MMCTWRELFSNYPSLVIVLLMYNVSNAVCVSCAVQLSKCILAQWPLRCIRTYESNGKGRFSLETGNHAPTGCGTFVFNTRSGQDNFLYDRIDSVINEMTALQEVCTSKYHLYIILNFYSRFERTRQCFFTKWLSNVCPGRSLLMN